MITALHISYLGKSQNEAVVKHTMKVKDSVFYKSQVTYTFSKFTTNLKEAFTTLQDYEEFNSENEELCLLHEKIKIDSANFNASMIRVIFRLDITTFESALVKTNVLVSTFFSMEHPTTGKNLRISSLEATQFVYSACDGKKFTHWVVLQ
eukprot:4563310-Ditylum_brightwellii.AAC.1